jgi:hypothetical protein
MGHPKKGGEEEEKEEDREWKMEDGRWKVGGWGRIRRMGCEMPGEKGEEQG